VYSLSTALVSLAATISDMAGRGHLLSRLSLRRFLKIRSSKFRKQTFVTIQYWDG
jgi:hypothetical protein